MKKIAALMIMLSALTFATFGGCKKADDAGGGTTNTTTNGGEEGSGTEGSGD